jgi:hypothetical protein
MKKEKRKSGEFDSAAVRERSANIGLAMKQQKEKYERLERHNNMLAKKLEKRARKKHSRGKWIGLLKGAGMGVAAAATGGAAAPAIAGMGLLGGAGGYLDASQGSDILPTAMKMAQMKMAYDLSMKSPNKTSPATTPALGPDLLSNPDGTPKHSMDIPTKGHDNAPQPWSMSGNNSQQASDPSSPFWTVPTSGDGLAAKANRPISFEEYYKNLRNNLGLPQARGPQ